VPDAATDHPLWGGNYWRVRAEQAEEELVRLREDVRYYRDRLHITSTGNSCEHTTVSVPMATVADAMMAAGDRLLIAYAMLVTLLASRGTTPDR
jgi:hypothetical protein